MNYSQLVVSALGEKSYSVQPSEERLKALSQRFPENFVTLWRTDGWCTYGVGLFSTLDPDQATPMLRDWPKVPDGSIAFGRDSFGNLFLLVNNEVHRLDVHRSIIALVALSADFFFDMEIFSPRFVDAFLEGERYRAARLRLGDLAIDECYAFVPALALGGAGDIDSIKKVRFLEHIAILAQIHAP